MLAAFAEWKHGGGVAFDCRREAPAVPFILYIRHDYLAGAGHNIYAASVGRKSGSAFRHSPRHTPLRAG